MPHYEYKCPECGQEFEIERRISDDSDQDCPACDFEKCDRQISRCTFHLKGGGWFGSALGADQIEKRWLNTFKTVDDTSSDGVSTKIADYIDGDE